MHDHHIPTWILINLAVLTAAAAYTGMRLSAKSRSTQALGTGSPAAAPGLSVLSSANKA